MRLIRMSAAAVLVLGAPLLSQTDVGVGPGLPNPYRPAELAWAFMPGQGRPWGSSAGVAIGPRDELWAVERCSAVRCDDSSLPTIHLLDKATGRSLRSFGGGMFAYPHGLYADPDGNIWVTDGAASKDGKRGHEAVKFSPDGKILMRIGKAGEPGGGTDHLTEPCDVITDKQGNIYIADGHGSGNATAPADYPARIVKFDKNGKYLKEWGRRGKGPGEFMNPHALAFDSQGRLFVADRFNFRVQIFDQEGTFIDAWTQFGGAADVFIDKDDTLYVIDCDSNPKNHPGWTRGIRIGSARTGKVTAFVPGTITQANPDGMAGEGVVKDAAGNLYAAENVIRGITRYQLLR
jgi:sugar lactone lactonase YvrE